MQPQKYKPVATNLDLTSRFHAPKILFSSRPLLTSEAGSSAVEYALMLGLVGSILLTTISAMGNASMATFSKISESLETAREYSPRQDQALAPQSVTAAPPPSN